MTRLPRLIHPLSLLGAAALSLAACDAQQPPDYTGEPLTVVMGRVVDGRTTPPPPAKVVLVWGQFGLMFPPFGESVNLTGNFPEAFRLELFNPPAQWLYSPAGAFPAGYYTGTTESQIALAHIIAVKQDVDPSAFIPSADIIGTAQDQVLVYAQSDVVAGSAGEAYLGTTVSAGFHLFRVKTTEEANAEYAPIVTCESQAADIAAWKACGVFTWLEALPTDALVHVELIDEGQYADFRPAGPTFVAAGTNINPPTGPTCGPMSMAMTPCP